MTCLDLWGPLELLDLEKAVVPRSKQRGGTETFAGYVGGWMTLGGRDRQGEEIDLRGVNVRPLLHDGWFNDNHSKDALRRYGYPVLAEVRRHPDFGDSWWTEGPILDTPRSQELMQMLRALKGTDRQFGFSVEGPPPVKSDPLRPNLITRADVWNVAITDRPVHADARITLVKSMGLPLQAVEDLLAYGQHNPAGAQNLLGLYKSLLAGEPAGNTAVGGGALQTESLGGAPTATKRRRAPKSPLPPKDTLTLDEAAEQLAEAVGDRGITRDIARAWLVQQATMRRQA
jgi:hypothetical protein